MPIRINLLAEQQAAEDARRRDPVKRAIWAGSALVALMILWAISLQMRLVSARAELSHFETKLVAVEENSKDARQRWTTSGQIEGRIGDLQRYSTNRFFSANILDALQQLMIDDVRVVELQSAHSYATNAEAKFRTNLVFTIDNPKAWQFWKARQPRTDIGNLISNQLAVITNKVEALKSAVELITKIDLTTNGTRVNAAIEVTRPIAAVEQITLTIKARDFGNPLGKRVDEFSKAIASHPYFAQRLRPGDGEGIRLRERAIQAQVDSDLSNASKPYIPFTIECRFQDIVRAHE
jgi:hypothetical protein